MELKSDSFVNYLIISITLIEINVVFVNSLENKLEIEKSNSHTVSENNYVDIFEKPSFANIVLDTPRYYTEMESPANTPDEMMNMDINMDSSMDMYGKPIKMKKKTKDKFNKVIKELDKGRLLKFDGSILVPTLMGILLKLATVIPVILAISTFVGTVSLIGSKLALFISAVLGLRTLIQYYNALNPPTPEPPPITQSEMNEIQNMISKQNQISEPPSVATPVLAPTSQPVKVIPIAMNMPTFAPMPDLIMKMSKTTTTVKPDQLPIIDTISHNPYNDLSYNSLLYGHQNHDQLEWTNPEILVDFNHGVKDSLYHPENYFVHHLSGPSGAAADTYNLINNNQLSLNGLQHHYVGSNFPHNLKRIDGSIEDKNRKVVKLKKISDKGTLKKLSDMMKSSQPSKNIISKVKIVKSVKS